MIQAKLAQAWAAPTAWRVMSFLPAKRIWSRAGVRRLVVPAGQWNLRGALPLRACSICCGQPLRPLIRAIRRLAVPFDDVRHLLARRAGDAPTRRLDREKELFALLRCQA